MSDQGQPNSADDAIAMVVDSFLKRFRRGERPALADLVAPHPELAEQLKDIIPALVELEQHNAATDSPLGSRTDAGGVTKGSHPQILGDYTILRRIGGGGMGEVYEAEHQALKSRVAVKVMHDRFRASDSYLRRFQIEARSAAKLHHTNIVSVFDFGEQDGVCYYVMQYIEGQPLDRILADLRRLKADDSRAINATVSVSPDAAAIVPRTVAQRLLSGQFACSTSLEFESNPPQTAAHVHGHDPATEGSDDRQAQGANEPASVASSSLGGSGHARYFHEVARIGAQVADALEYAHRSGVLHRDIKPPNLLLDEMGNVWVTDFGLAKLEGGDETSHSHELVGTLRYMAPERFRGISNRSGDVYSLGATLYELITLQPAFDGHDQPRLIDRIVHDQPERPRKIDRQVPRDLETIVLKSLAKDPKDRFRSAREMAEELTKFVEGRPILSRPISSVERSWRWCRRNPWLALAGSLAAATTTALAIGSTIAAKVYYDGREEYAAVARNLAISEIRGREKLFDSMVAQARASRYSRQPGQRFDSLKSLAEAAKIGRALGYPAARFDRLRDEAIASLMLVDLKQVGPAIRIPAGCHNCAFDSGMTRYALRLQDGTILVRNHGDDREIARFSGQVGECWLFKFSPDGKYLAFQNGNNLVVADIARKSLCWTAPAGVQPHACDFSPDSQQIIVGLRQSVVLVYELATGRSRRLSAPGPVGRLAYSPDGSQIALTHGGSSPACRIVDAQTGRQTCAFEQPNPATVTWSHDGSTVAIGDEVKNEITLWRATRGVRQTTIALPSLSGGGLSSSFHPAGAILASDGWENRLRFWDTATGRERLSLNCSSDTKFSTDGRIFVREGIELRVCKVDPAVEYTSLVYAAKESLNHGRPSVHRDGRILAVGTGLGIELWDLARNVELGFLAIGNAWHSAFEPSGDLVTNGDVGILRWPVQADRASGRIGIGPPRSLSPRGTHCGIAFDRTGTTLAVAGKRDARILQGTRTIATIGPLQDCRGLSLSPDAKWLLTWNHDFIELTIWSLPGGAEEASFPIETDGSGLFSPDGKWLVVSNAESSQVLEVGSWREVRRFDGPIVSISPDGRLAIVRESQNVVGMVEVATGRRLARLDRPDPQAASWFTFSPDGARLFATTNDPPSTQVIDLRAIRRGLTEIGLDWDAPPFPEDDPARTDLPALPRVQVDYGFLAPHLDHYGETAQALVAKYTERIKKNRDDGDAYHHRAEALAELGRPAQALDDVSRALVFDPKDTHLLRLRSQINARAFKRWEPAIADLEAALAVDPSLVMGREYLASYCNNLAWRLAAAPASNLDLDRALKLSARAVELEPGEPTYLNTRGVALYRAERFADAVPVLQKSLAAGNGLSDGFDLFVLAMAHHRLGHRSEARQCFDRALAWTGHGAPLSGEQVKELAGFRAEAEKILAKPNGELPDDVFANPVTETRGSRP